MRYQEHDTSFLSKDDTYSAAFAETDEIVVTARLSNNVSFDGGGISWGGSWNLMPNFLPGVDYGAGTSNPTPFEPPAEPPVEEDTEIVVVAKGLDALKVAIDTILSGTRWFLPKSEENRLEALATTLDLTSKALKLGEIDLATAETAVETSLKVALDTMSGLGTGALMSALGAWATSIVPNIALRAAVTAGLGVFGIVLDNQIDDLGISQAISHGLAHAIFAGAEAVADVLNSIHDNIGAGLNAITGQPYDMRQQMSFEVEVSGNFGEYDGIVDNGNEYELPVQNVSSQGSFRGSFAVSANADFGPEFIEYSGGGPEIVPFPGWGSGMQMSNTSTYSNSQFDIV